MVPGTHLVRLPDEAGEGIGIHLAGISVHVQFDGLVLITVQMEAADPAQDAYGTAAVPVDVTGLRAVRGAEVMEEGTDDDAGFAQFAPVFQSVAAGFEGVPGKASGIAVMGVAACREEVTVADVVDNPFDTGTAGASEKSLDLCADLL